MYTHVISHVFTCHISPQRSFVGLSTSSNITYQFVYMWHITSPAYFTETKCTQIWTKRTKSHSNQTSHQSTWTADDGSWPLCITILFTHSIILDTDFCLGVFEVISGTDVCWKFFGEQVEFKALLFVPSALPWELTANMFDENSKNMRLYVKRVFINDNFQVACAWNAYIWLHLCVDTMRALHVLSTAFWERQLPGSMCLESIHVSAFLCVRVMHSFCYVKKCVFINFIHEACLIQCFMHAWLCVCICVKPHSFTVSSLSSSTQTWKYAVCQCRYVTRVCTSFFLTTRLRHFALSVRVMEYYFYLVYLRITWKLDKIPTLSYPRTLSSPSMYNM